MRRIAGIAALLALCAAPAWAQPPACQLKMVNSVSLTMVDDGRVALAPVTINSTKTNLLVDTGDVFTQLSAEVINNLKLPIQESGVKLVDLYGNASDGFVRIDSFILGRMQARNTAFMVSTFRPSAGDTPVAGVLAPDFMGRFDVEFDFANAKMNYLAPDHCPGKVIYWPT